jgi:hypothetical protein
MIFKTLRSPQIGSLNLRSQVFRSAIAAVLCVGMMFAQTVNGASPKNRGIGYTGAIPYQGSIEEVVSDAAAATTIPMATFTQTATKDGKSYTDTIVGASPFGATKTTTTINVVLVPVIVQIGSTTFSPTANDACIVPKMTPLAAFQQSPLLHNVVFDGGAGSGHAATINGVNVGTTTYPDAVRRAEFWSAVTGTSYHTAFHVTTVSPWTITAAEVQSLGGGNVLTSSCAKLGVLPTNSFQSYIQNTVIPGISAITPTSFALFLMSNVVTTTSASLNCSNGCLIGYHAAFGSPVQTYAVSEYDSTQQFWYAPGIRNISILSHEIGEWMDDPLVGNPTPGWGNSGQVFGCDTVWEVGDPLTGMDFPAIQMPNGVNYDPQELAFYSWYYNAASTSSLGAGGKFSSNRTFARPSKACPPGGTF